MTSRQQRKLRSLLLSSLLWRKRVVFWLGALSVGVFASCFALAADWAQHAFDAMRFYVPYAPLVISPLAFGVCAYFTRTYFPAAVGSGIPQAIAARIQRDLSSRNQLLGMKVIIGKVALTLLALLGGASIGREGPTVQLGAGLLLLCATYSGIFAQRGVVIAGAAAGVAAAFNTPLAGIVFAIEEMARAFEHRNSSIVLTAILLAGAAATSIMGNYDYFGYTVFHFDLGRDWDAVLLIGIMGGTFGAAFTRILISGEGYLRGLRNQFGTRHFVLFAAACGFVVGMIGIATDGATFGSGYAMGHDLLHGEMAPAWWQLPAKFAATALSAISGIPGGIFSPSLSVGTAMGSLVTGIFPDTPLQIVMILAMVAYFAGVTQAPITAFVIVLEITGKSASPIPLIAASVVAAGVSHVLCPVSLYHALAKRFLVDAREAVLQQDAPAAPAEDTQAEPKAAPVRKD